jgi:arabinofuranosyltransferase
MIREELGSGSSVDNPPGASRLSMRSRLLLALTPGVVFGLIFIWMSGRDVGEGRRFTLFDDAMISMSYARTFARGGGLVWYQGAPRVEGFTNPLWTFYMAFLHWSGLGGSTISLVVMLTGLVAIAATGYLAARLSMLLVPGSRRIPPAVAFVVSSTFPILYWALRGMEVGLITLLSVACMVVAASIASGSTSAADRRRLISILAALCMIGVATRLDFTIVVVVIIIWLWWTLGPGHERRVTIACLGGAIIAAVVAMSIARLSYYGSMLPNTYVLKMNGVSVWTRLGRGLVTDLKMLPVLALAAAGGVVLWRAITADARRILILLVAVGLGVLAYSTWVGGDAWEEFANRYVAVTVVVSAIIAVPGIAIWANSSPRRPSAIAILLALGLVVLCSAAAAITEDFGGRSGERALLALIGFLLLLGAVIAILWIRGSAGSTPVLLASLGIVAVLFASSGFGFVAWVRSLRGDTKSRGALAIELDQDMVDLGIALNAIIEPGGSVAVIWAGAPVYESDRAAIDLLGKSDAVIAAEESSGYFRPGHNKYDPGYSIGQLRPDVVAQLRGPETPNDREDMHGWGYALTCLSTGAETVEIWVLDTSDRIDRGSPLLGSCP